MARSKLAVWSFWIILVLNLISILSVFSSSVIHISYFLEYVGFVILYVGWILGLIFLIHGLPKIKDLKTTWQNFEMMGFKPGVLWGTVVAIVEFFGGLLLISGLLTSAAAFILTIEMIVS